MIDLKNNYKNYDRILVLECDNVLDKDNLLKNKYIIWNNTNDYFCIKQKLNENNEIAIMIYDGFYYYHLLNPKISNFIFEIKDCQFRICFDYFEIRTTPDDFKITNASFHFMYEHQIEYISNEKNSLITYNFESEDVCYGMIFNRNMQQVFLESKKLSKDMLYETINKLFIFNYFLCGKMAKLDYPISLNNKENSIKIYGGFLYEGRESARFSEFPIVSMNYQDYAQYFLKFSNDYYHLMSTQLTVFMSTQYKNKLNIDQNIAILLNALEGFIKSQKICNKSKLKVFEKKQKNLIIEDIIKTLDKYCNSEKFNQCLQSLDFKDDSLIENVKNKIRNNNGRLNEMTFDEMLDLSKEVSKSATSFVTHSKLEFQFWNRCKMHRNYFAHLTDSKNKGFNTEFSCVHAMYILSTFFILIVLKVLGLEPFENQNMINKHANDLKKWRNIYIDKFDPKVEKEYSY